LLVSLGVAVEDGVADPNTAVSPDPTASAVAHRNSEIAQEH